MKVRRPETRLARCLIATLAASIPYLCDGAEKSFAAEEQLLVMLQGGDRAQLKAIIAEAGGQVTHELPIVDAIGASLTSSQLATVRETAPKIERVIDDLAWTPEPEPQSTDACALAGGIELTWENTAATWRLFNKGEAPLTLSSLSATWPAELGDLRDAIYGEKSISSPQTDNRYSRSFALSDQPPLPPNGSATVRLTFSAAPANPYLAQSRFAMQVVAAPDCEAELAPSYADPRSDTYYPTVSGASSLHQYGITGEGITVAVLDSGLWEGNPELTLNTRGEKRIVARYDAITDETVDIAFDESGHGTHMTSVLARSGPTSRPKAPQPSYRGIAPDVQVAVVKAFGESGEAGFLDLVRGVQWVVENRERLGIKVLNLSFSARPRWPYWEDPLNQALMRAWNAGIFVVAAGGNEGPEPMSIGSPGNLPYLLTVGAITDSWTEGDRNDDYIPDFSSRGPTPMGHIKPDVVAPGGHMAGLTRPGSNLAREFPEYFLSSGEFVMTGTSQAAALVSGLAALMLQVDPSLSNDQLKCMLRSSAEPAIDVDGRLAYSPFVQGEGRVNLQRAITLGSKDCDLAPLNLEADLKNETHYQGSAIFNDNAAPSLPDGDRLISDHAPEKGFSERRRWGAFEHLERLDAPPSRQPFDWPAVFESEQRRIEELSSGGDT